MNSRNKGKAGELELVHVLNSYGYKTRRGQQYCGANGDADVVGLPGIHIECKRTEQRPLEKWIEQARDDARVSKEKYNLPTIMHRRNRSEWLVTMRLDDWQIIYDSFYEKITGEKGVSK